MTLNVCGTRVSVGFFFCLTLCLALCLDKTNTAALTLCAAAVHEFGHIFCMLLCGERPGAIRLAPFGLSITRCPSGSYRREAAIALAGPCINLLLAAVLTVVMCVCKVAGLSKAIAVNIAIALFNLLPIEPLDCGTAVCALLCSKINSQRAEKAVFCIGIACLFLMTVCGFYVLIKSR